jgi:hypothetical protein
MEKLRNPHMFTSIRVEGGLFPAEHLKVIANLDAEFQTEADYGITRSLNLKDEIARYWRIANDLYVAFSELRNRKDVDLTKTTVDGWLVPLFREVLGYYDLHAARSVTIGDRQFPITHWACDGRVPMVFTSSYLDLDRSNERFGESGGRRTPYGLLQEFLNANEHCLWGVVSNGIRLRLVRDNPSLTRPAYIEIDLEQMFEEQLYPDFVTMWLLIHVSRIKPKSDEPSSSIIERWRSTAHEAGQRALHALRLRVTDALRELGCGFLRHPDNDMLRTQIMEGRLSTYEFYQQLLRLVYRFLFLFSAEERDLLHSPLATEEQRNLYRLGYSLSRLRERAARRRMDGKHSDLWTGVQVVFRALQQGAEALGLPALGGIFSADQCPNLDAARLSNEYLLKAIFSLSYVETSNGLMRVNYRDMDTEELGSVYEGLLELHPYIDVDTRPWTFGFVSDKGTGSKRGSERKNTGSYYTPSSLVSELIRSTLEPVMAEAVKRHPEDPKKALLSLRIIDPACGSGHFLLAAARRMAVELARIDAGIETPDEHIRRHALRLVVQHCIYGVDRNPLAVELCKTALWMEAIEPGKPLSYLDSHIRCGDSLVGVLDPQIMSSGVPAEAYAALSGDNAAVCRELKQRNRKSGKGVQLGLFDSQDVSRLAAETIRLHNMPEETVQDVEAKRVAFHTSRNMLEWRREELLANLYVGAFFAKKIPETIDLVPLTEDLNRVHMHLAPRAGVAEYASKLAAEYRFFHWYLEFPEVMERGGFDVVLGNPPWERVKLQEQEFFANRSPEIAKAPNKAAREKLIESLSRPDATHAEKALFQLFQDAKHEAEAASQFMRKSGRYPLTGTGDVNTYAVFAETFLHLLSPTGRAGLIVPTGIATDDSTKQFIEKVLTERHLASLIDFENRDAIFPGVHRSYKFCLLTLARKVERPQFSFFLTNVDQLTQAHRQFTLSPEEIRLINPNTKTCPVFRSRADAELTKKIYTRVPVLINESQRDDGNPWGVEFDRLFDMSNDSNLFRTHQQLEECGARMDGVLWTDADGEIWVPLYEGKMIHHFDHRWATFDSSDDDFRDITDQEKAQPHYEPLPRYWVPLKEVKTRLSQKGWTREWLIGWRAISRATDERSLIATVFPATGVGNSLPIICIGSEESTAKASALAGNLAALPLDYVVRQKVGGTNINYHHIKQFPVLPPDAYSEEHLSFIVPRVLELVYTSQSMRAFAAELGYVGQPFGWDPERRAVLRAELDAYYSYMYGLTRDELRYILDPTDVYGDDYPSETFRVLKEKELAEYGEYRTQRLVLEAWDRLVDEGIIRES